MGLIPGIIKQIIKEREKEKKPQRGQIGVNWAQMGWEGVSLSPLTKMPLLQARLQLAFSETNVLFPQITELKKKKIKILGVFVVGDKAIHASLLVGCADGYQTVKWATPQRSRPSQSPGWPKTLVVISVP